MAQPQFVPGPGERPAIKALGLGVGETRRQPSAAPLPRQAGTYLGWPQERGQAVPSAPGGWAASRQAGAPWRNDCRMEALQGDEEQPSTQDQVPPVAGGQLGGS